MWDLRIVFLRFCRPERATNVPSIEGQGAVQLEFQRADMSGVTQEREVESRSFSGVELL